MQQKLNARTITTLTAGQDGGVALAAPPTILSNEDVTHTGKRFAIQRRLGPAASVVMSANGKDGQEEEEEVYTIKKQEETFQDPTVLAFRRLKYFFGRVTVGLGPGMQPFVYDFSPAWPDDTSAIATVSVQYPMG